MPEEPEAKVVATYEKPKPPVASPERLEVADDVPWQLSPSPERPLNPEDLCQEFIDFTLGPGGRIVPIVRKVPR